MQRPKTLKDAWVLIEQLIEIDRQLRLDNERLRKRVDELKRQLKTNSRNSSKPPSTDQKCKPPSGKLKGGAPKGHKGHFRTVFLAESVTEHVQVIPDSCPRCGSHELVSERKPQFHREVDLPQSAVIREYRLEQCRCQQCGKHVKADLPPGVSKTAMGARLSALIADWSCRFHLPVRKIADLVKQLTGYRFCPATILACQQRCSEAIASTFEAIGAQSKQEQWLGADETPWSTHGSRRYVWIACGDSTTWIRIQERRNIAAAQALLGDTQQPLVTDRYGAYKPRGPHQYCLAHFKRNIKKLEAYPDAQELQMGLEIDLACVFDAWRLYQEGGSSISSGSLARATA